MVLSPADKPVMVMKILFSTRRVHAASTREHEFNVSLFQIGGLDSVVLLLLQMQERDTHTHTRQYDPICSICVYMNINDLYTVYVYKYM